MGWKSVLLSVSASLLQWESTILLPKEKTGIDSALMQQTNQKSSTNAGTKCLLKKKFFKIRI